MEVCLYKLRQNIGLILERDKDDCESKLLTGYLKTNLRIYEDLSGEATSNATASRENLDGKKVGSENKIETHFSLPPLKLNLTEGYREVFGSRRTGGIKPDSKMSQRSAKLSCINTDVIEYDSKQLKHFDEFSSIDSNRSKMKLQRNDKTKNAWSRRQKLKQNESAPSCFSSTTNTFEPLPSDRRCPARPNSAAETVNGSLCELFCFGENSRFTLADRERNTEYIDYKSGSDLISYDNNDTNCYMTSEKNPTFTSQNSLPLSDTSKDNQSESFSRRSFDFENGKRRDNEDSGCSIFHLTDVHIEHNPKYIQTKEQIQDETKSSQHIDKDTTQSQHDPHDDTKQHLLTETKGTQYSKSQAAYLEHIDDILLKGNEDTERYDATVNVDDILKFIPGTLSRSTEFPRIPDDRISTSLRIVSTEKEPIKSRGIKSKPICIPVHSEKPVLLKMQHRQDKFVNRRREVHEEGRLLPISLSGLKKGGYSVMTPYMASVVWSIMEDEHVDKSRD